MECRRALTPGNLAFRPARRRPHASWTPTGQRADEAVTYADGVFVEHVRDRRQTPSLLGDGSLVLGTGTAMDPMAAKASAAAVRAVPAPKPARVQKAKEDRKSTGWWIAGTTLLAASAASGGVALLETRAANEASGIAKLNRKIGSAERAQGVMGLTAALGTAGIVVAVVR